MTRRGAMLIELAVAATLVGTLLMLSLQLFSAALAQRRAADQRHCANLELGNVLERFAARPWAELSTAALAAEKPSAWAERQLPGAELKIDVATSPDQPDAKRITAALRWRDRSNQYLAPATLTTWRYKIGD
jgi:hypothetical protein